MNAHVLFGFITRVEEKRLNARLVSHFISFRNECKKFNNTGAGVLDFFSHIISRLLLA